ncbi:MAG: reverse transcriptase family protein [Pseudomonadota bacterium]
MSAVPPERLIAAEMLAVWPDRSAMVERISGLLYGWRSRRTVRATGLVERAMTGWQRPYPPAEKDLAALVAEASPLLLRDHVALDSPGFAPLKPLVAAGLPRIDGTAGLAEWLNLSDAELHWFADCDGRLARGQGHRLGHYSQIWLRKRSGGRRLVEAPLPRLKALQRRILHDILDRVPAHANAFGFVAGRNCVQAAARHAGEAVVLRCDLKDYFASVRASRVHAVFRCLGYTHPVARLLTGLVTVRTPPDCLATLPASDRGAWRQPHLPQGAPTSPALANLSSRGMDIRLTALARSWQANYSRYADDMVFSGGRHLADPGLFEAIERIVRDCAFRLNPGKTRLMRQGRRQQVTGVVVNRHLNLPRDQYDTLKAILNNCMRHGPSTQNRAGHPNLRAHLEGRIQWAETLNPHRGLKLRAIFDRIAWG